MDQADSPRFIEVRAERPVTGGAMLAYDDGCVVLVTGAIPGERVRVRVDTRRHHVIHATVAEIIEPDRDRRDTSGDSACGGQLYRHIRYERQLTLKSEIVRDALHRIGRFEEVAPVPVMGSPERGYRLRARLHVGRRGLGFLRTGTRDICEVTTTGQLLPETERVVTELGQRLGCGGSVRTSLSHVDIAENVVGNERVVHYALRRRLTYGCLAEAASLPGITGVTVCPARGGIERIAGSPTVGDPVNAVMGGVGSTGAVLRRHAASFFQANRYLISELVGTVCQRVSPGPVIDLYAGVGLFSVSLAARGESGVTAVERDRLAVTDLRRNTRPFGTRVGVVGASVESYLSQRTDRIIGTVVADPPRAGLARGLIERLVDLHARTIVYVSCDPATFARDLRRFREAGYDASDIQAFDQFPNTAHIELVATLRR